MIFDKDGCLVMEKDGDPGDLGDSCAETSRFCVITGGVTHGGQRLEQFVSSHGFLRHPNAPYGPPRSLTSWRESDASSDQVFPLLMAADIANGSLAETIRARLSSSWHVAPGKIAAPVLMALVFKQYWLMKKLTDVQTLIFKFPWRWSDSKKWFERSESSSADYLNYFVTILFLRRRGIEVEFNEDVTKGKIISYYADQPNSEWFVDLYLQHFSVGELHET